MRFWFKCIYLCDQKEAEEVEEEEVEESEEESDEDTQVSIL